LLDTDGVPILKMVKEFNSGRRFIPASLKYGAAQLIMMIEHPWSNIWHANWRCRLLEKIALTRSV